MFTWREETQEEYDAFHQLFRLGCSPVYIERLDNPNQEERPVFTRMMEDIQEKDTIYIRQFSYLANSIDSNRFGVECMRLTISFYFLRANIIIIKI